MHPILDACTELAQADFADGDWLIREGLPGGRFYVLVSGEVMVLKGETEITRVSEPGAVFGEMSALLDLPYSASVPPPASPRPARRPAPRHRGRGCPSRRRPA
jgi:hypothetical protein